MTSSFSKRLKELREANKMTQGQLGDKINATRQAISNYEMGKREPDYITLEALADTFNVDINYLLGKTNKTTFLPSSTHRPLTPEELKILDPYNQLNAEGKEKAVSYTWDLVDSNKYIYPTRQEMITYLSNAQIAAMKGYADIRTMTDDELKTIYTTFKEEDKWQK